MFGVKTVLRAVSAVLFAPLGWGLRIFGDENAMNEAYNLKRFDYGVGHTNTWCINWPGPPRRPWQCGNEAYFRPIMELDGPVKSSFQLIVQVREDVPLWPDNLLGKFYARFDAGQTTPTIIYENHDSDGNRRGFPVAVTDGEFWLALTEERRFEGNAGTGTKKYAYVFLEVVEIPTYIKLLGSKRSETHQIESY